MEEGSIEDTQVKYWEKKFKEMCGTWSLTCNVSKLQSEKTETGAISEKE